MPSRTLMQCPRLLPESAAVLAAPVARKEQLERQPDRVVRELSVRVLRVDRAERATSRAQASVPSGPRGTDRQLDFGIMHGVDFDSAPLHGETSIAPDGDSGRLMKWVAGPRESPEPACDQHGSETTNPTLGSAWWLRRGRWRRSRFDLLFLVALKIARPHPVARRKLTHNPVQVLRYLAYHVEHLNVARVFRCELANLEALHGVDRRENDDRCPKSFHGISGYRPGGWGLPQEGMLQRVTTDASCCCARAAALSARLLSPRCPASPRARAKSAQHVEGQTGYQGQGQKRLGANRGPGVELWSYPST